jgi:RimJ/RimL family protein N-acetyltransferase
LKIKGGYLSPLKPENVNFRYVDGLNDPEVNRYLVGVKNKIQTKETVTEFIQCNLESSNAVLFGIWITGEDNHCGTVRLHAIEYNDKTSHIGICLFDKSVWGKGVGSNAVEAVTKWALNDLDLRWVEAGIYNENIASQKIFIAAGYEWFIDIPDKYFLDDKPTIVKIFVAKNHQ